MIDRPQRRSVLVGKTGMDLAKLHEEDARLVTLAQNGERRAFSELVQRHHAGIYRVCLGILHDAEDAADATQDAFIRAFDKLDTFHHHSRFKTWMTRVAVNVSLNTRGQQRDGVPWDDVVNGVTPSAEDTVLRAEVLGQLHAALHTLPFHYRVAVVLHDVEGHSYRNVAAMLDAQEGTVRAWAYRGRVQLKDLLT